MRKFLCGAEEMNSSSTIDVLIPTIEKDLATLPHVIDGLRRNVKHKIGQIYVVSPQSSKISALCKRKGCIFVDEKKVLPISKKDIHYRSARWERSGWLYQQLLKFSGDTICKHKYFLVIDADTVLIRPHSFLSHSKGLYYCRNWSQPEYFRTYRKLLGSKAPSPKSFVTHYMLFDKSKLSQLKRTIEAKHNLPWYRAIIRSIDKTKQFGFSEYETYANYVYSTTPKSMILKNALNKGLKVKASTLPQAQMKKLALSYRSLSFHERKGYSRSTR
ncbi:hypothetical protein J2T12_000185 [Paenibacillus anaericanus]|nr:hypothetical protein [Paenibacillus anaericanus]